MAKVKKSEYIKISRVMVKKLFDETCFGKGSLYIETLKREIPKEYIDKVNIVNVKSLSDFFKKIMENTEFSQRSINI